MMIKEYLNSGYFVSDDGIIYSTHNKNKQLYPLATTIMPNGYVVVNLYKINKKCYVHRLVAELFIPNPHNKKEVNHKDFNKENNIVQNLEWVSPKENCRHYRAESSSRIETATSGRHGKLYVDTKLEGEFYSLQQAKLYCKEHFHCSLQTAEKLNVNYKNKIIFIREDNPIDINQFWLDYKNQATKYIQKTKQRNKKDKGFSCKLYHDNILIGTFSTIRDAEKVAHHCFKKSNNYIYKDWRLEIC